MSKLLKAQEVGLMMLRFILGIQNYQPDLFYTGWFDNMFFEGLGDVISVGVTAGDVELGYNTYTKALGGASPRAELCDAHGFEGLELKFTSEGVLAVLDSVHAFSGGKEFVAGTKLVRANRSRGVLEITIKGFGTVFVEYRLTFKDTGRITIHATKLSCSWNPNVTPKPSSRVV